VIPFVPSHSSREIIHSSISIYFRNFPPLLSSSSMLFGENNEIWRGVCQPVFTVFSSTHWIKMGISMRVVDGLAIDFR
jgi:hypothetical protein